MRRNPASEPGHVTTGDIFDDLGCSPAEALEAKIKADIWRALVDHIEAQGLTQSDLAAALKLHQPDVSNLLRGKLSKFSITKLIQLAAKMDLEARVQVQSRRNSAGSASSEHVRACIAQ
jgi:predicted XRE-type DNA-binding protein